jgi:hypothetical protein
LGSGLNAGNIGAEIDVIKPALPAQLTLRLLFTSLSDFAHFVPLSPCSFCCKPFSAFSHDAVIRVFDEFGNRVERHKHAISKNSEKVQAAILRKEEENGRP